MARRQIDFASSREYDRVHGRKPRPALTNYSWARLPPTSMWSLVICGERDQVDAALTLLESAGRQVMRTRGPVVDAPSAPPAVVPAAVAPVAPAVVDPAGSS